MRHDHSIVEILTFVDNYDNDDSFIKAKLMVDINFRALKSTL